MSEENEKQPGNVTARQHLSRVRMMSPEERRLKAAEILAMGLIKKMQQAGGAANDNADEVTDAAG